MESLLEATIGCMQDGGLQAGVRVELGGLFSLPAGWPLSSICAKPPCCSWAGCLQRGTPLLAAGLAARFRVHCCKGDEFGFPE